MNRDDRRTGVIDSGIARVRDALARLKQIVNQPPVVRQSRFFDNRRCVVMRIVVDDDDFVADAASILVQECLEQRPKLRSAIVGRITTEMSGCSLVSVMCLLLSGE